MTTKARFTYRNFVTALFWSTFMKQISEKHIIHHHTYYIIIMHHHLSINFSPNLKWLKDGMLYLIRLYFFWLKLWNSSIEQLFWSLVQSARNLNRLVNIIDCSKCCNLWPNNLLQSNEGGIGANLKMYTKSLSIIKCVNLIGNLTW